MNGATSVTRLTVWNDPRSASLMAVDGLMSTQTTFTDAGTNDTHTAQIDWDDGTTEPGSSGSPLFDQNHRVIGQLHGGYAACGNDEALYRRVLPFAGLVRDDD